MEDYLEVILELSEREDVVRVTDIAGKLNIAKASVAQALNSLKEAGLVTQDKYGPVWLTPKGKLYATEVRRRHRALVSFLTNVLGVDPRIAEVDACRMEHVISAQTMERLVAFLEATGKGPERSGNNPPAKETRPLTGLAPGDRGTVVRVTSAGGFRRRLLDMGVVPGSEIKVEGVAPLGDPIEVTIKGYHLTLRKAEAACVIVEIAK